MLRMQKKSANLVKECRIFALIVQIATIVCSCYPKFTDFDEIFQDVIVISIIYGQDQNLLPSQMS